MSIKSQAAKEAGKVELFEDAVHDLTKVMLHLGLASREEAENTLNHVKEEKINLEKEFSKKLSIDPSQLKGQAKNQIRQIEEMARAKKAENQRSGNFGKNRQYIRLALEAAHDIEAGAQILKQVSDRKLNKDLENLTQELDEDLQHLGTLENHLRQLKSVEGEIQSLFEDLDPSSFERVKQKLTSSRNPEQVFEAEKLLDEKVKEEAEIIKNQFEKILELCRHLQQAYDILTEEEKRLETIFEHEIKELKKEVDKENYEESYKAIKTRGDFPDIKDLIKITNEKEHEIEDLLETVGDLEDIYYQSIMGSL